MRPSILLFHPAGLPALCIGLVLVTTCPSASASHLNAQEALVDRQIQSGEYVEALSSSVDLFRARLAASGPRAPETVEALRRVGVALSEVGDLELADAIWRLYLICVSDVFGPCDPRVAEGVYRLGGTSKGVSSDYDDILPHYVNALSLLDSSSPDHQDLIGRITRGQAHYHRYRDKAKSLELFEAALATLERAGPQSAYECAETRVWLGWTLLHMGRHDNARAALTSAREEFEAIGLAQHALMGTIESSLADLDALAGRWSVAEQGYQRAIDLFVKARQDGSTRFAEFPLHGCNLLALTQLKQGRVEEAWASLQRYRSPAGKRLNSLREWSSRAPRSYHLVAAARADVVAKRTLRRHNNGWSSIDEIDWDSVVDELDANARLSKLEAGYYAPDVSRRALLEDLQASLPDDWAYIGWLDSRVGNELLCSTGPILDSRWMYIVRAQGPIRWIPLWEHATELPLTAMRYESSQYGIMMARAAAWVLRVDDDPEMAALARRLAAQEFNVALPYLADVSQIVVEFFEDPTGYKAFESLAIRDGEYIGERFVVSYSPSAELFVAARKRPDRPAGVAPTVIAIGDAVFSRDAPSPLAASSSINLSHHRTAIERAHHRAATNGDPDALAALPRLPFAGEELDRVRAIYPHAEILQGHDASEANVRKLFAPTAPLRAAPAVDIVHFATHALAETPLRQRCALALSRLDVDSTPANDGLVDALEIQLGWDLDADLVTLSGCQTASGPGWFRGEPMGLSTALLGVGAKSVLASLWKVDDLATAKLMGRFYENLSGTYSDVRRGRVGAAMTKAAALAEAKNWLREYTDAGGSHPFAHPVYWSGFVLMGDPD